MIEWIHPDELRNHPTNVSIYGDTPDPDLVASVKEHGVFDDHPIGYVMDGDFRVIVSGHRRRQAAKIAKLDMVPVIRLTELEGDDLAIKERIILSNKQRVKTNEQMAREAALLAEIVKERGTEARLANLRHDTPESATRAPSAQSNAKEAVAESLHVSPRTAQRLINAGKALADAETKGDAKKAAAIKKGLAKSASAGAKAAKKKPKANPGKSAASLLAKVEADFNKAAANLAPLVRTWDDMKRADSAFDRKHKELLGHHSRLFQLCEDGKRVLKSLKAAWSK